MAADPLPRTCAPSRHTWGLAQHVEDVGPEEMERRMAAFDEEDPGAEVTPG